PKDWDAVCARWIELFKSPAHLRVDGKPLLIIFSPGEMPKEFGGTAGMRAAFTTLREKVKAAGLPGVTIAACVRDSKYFKYLQECGYDLFTGYNYPGIGAQGAEKRQAFASLIEGSQKIWDGFAAESPVPYIPAVTAGWDMRPWEDASKPPNSFYYPDRTPAEVGRFVARAVKWLDQHPDKATRERLLVIYAWNENGEGGYLTPTKAEGAAYLQAVKKALAEKAP
ncbi:MAG: glycoside hydrolase family 99-like domain-containing protein, partial [Planctomycetota bacterium]|nr:glycoside hydrolase family 99-like domain-containing protein [Planctomycetota bacterium]